MDLKFIITLTEHRALGLVFAPYVVRKERSQDYYTVYDRATNISLKSYESILSPEEVQLVKLIEDYQEQQLQKLFSKKKISSREFISAIDNQLLESKIRPYIERRMTQCIDILETSPVPVYHKILHNKVYEDDRIYIVEEESSSVFNFIKTPEGLQYFLSIEHNGNELNLNGKQGLIVTNQPCSVIIDNKLFVFRDIDSKKIIPFFTKEAINIPKSAEKKYFETFVRTAIKKYKVNARGFEILDEQKKPTPTLNIECDLSGKFVLVLRFIYDRKTIYYANRKTEQKVSCEFKGEEVRFIRIKRDYQFENDCISSLLSLGMVNKEGPYFQPLKKNKEIDGTCYNVINWINFNSSLIRKSGFSVAQSDPKKSYYLDDFKLKMEVSEKSNDWFDIEARVEFAGFKIPFVSFYTNILEREREFVLPDGRVVILPEEWFESYRDLLSFSKVENGSIILEKQHFPILNKIKKGISGNFRESLLSLIEDEKHIIEIPDGIKAKLRSYQVEGYSWMHRLYQNGFGGCLADDMGLGKTLQTLVLLRKVISESTSANDKKDKPLAVDQLSLFEDKVAKITLQTKASLIVVPTSLVHNWINEVNNFMTDIVINAYVGTQRGELKEVCDKSNLVITSYGILRNDLEQFIKIGFLYVVLDESQMIKNPASKTYRAVMQLKAENRIVLTGTPIENSLTDLWAQINFLNPGLLGNLTFFRSEFQLPIEKYNDAGKREKLQQLISPFVLRRTKSQVAKELPPLNEQLVYCNLNDQQEIYYEREKSKARNIVLEKMTQLGLNKSAVFILKSLTRLRQIANHPAMVDEEYFSGSGKFSEVTRNLLSLKTEGNKALVFSSFVKHLDLIADFLDNEKIKYAWLTGDTKDRETEIKKFQDDPDCSFFLISVKAGGVGLNLTAAEYVFILDPWWNPAVEMQALSRAHRIGQDKRVFVYRFISRNTLEEKIIKLQERKSELSEAFIGRDYKGITKEQVLALFN
ncbi:MAG: DEAD/DEAH box helicase [Bacteroidales bacterium]|nr:DEAD/DEAH box helicase [Bacteroidales bacterium]